MAAAAGGAVLLLALLAVQSARTQRYADGDRALRLSHLSMVEQQTGLRGFLVTGQDAFLEPYRHGRDALAARNTAARKAFRDQAEVEARLLAAERRQRDWVDDYAVEASAGLTAGQTAGSAFGQDRPLFDRYRAAQSDAERAADLVLSRARSRQTRLLAVAVALSVGAILGSGLLLLLRPASPSRPSAPKETR